ncbi:DUF7519 family protein [Natrononativus amylolyticus]|uniref:DUF7519 family protein n=1 Tax=Natrononativus amylolyticus TaxID=2963434 RepID=UPI0020CBE3EC|nr:hypothetical protein [Natrononativus amylolyticus]
MSEITRRPTRIASVVAAGAAIVAVAAVAMGSLNATAIAVLGAGTLGAGLIRGHRLAVDVGSLFVFGGVVVSGIGSETVEPTMVATVATVVAWDLGQDSIDLGDQLGREAETARLEAVHVVSSLFVGLLAATLGYAVFAFAAGGQPAGAVVLLLLAACFVVMGLGSRG